jgi:hypothetical protein
MGMPTPPTGRSVRIGDDERGAWSSDRPRREGAPRRPPDISVRCRVLRPTDSLRYSPGSLLVVASPAVAEREAWAERLVKTRGALLLPGKIEALLAGRVPDEDVPLRAAELLEATAVKRMDAADTVVITLDGLDPDERGRWAQLAAARRRPRHFVLLEPPKDAVDDEARPALNDLRRRLDAGELGAEGYQTALRLSAVAAFEVKRLAFQPPPRDDD